MRWDIIILLVTAGLGLAFLFWNFFIREWSEAEINAYLDRWAD